MDTALQGLHGVFVYLDDILIASNSKEQHLNDLKEVFTRLSNYGLVLNKAKCQFGVQCIDFLGHRVNGKGIVPLPTKVDVIKNYPKPSSVKQLQEFVGMVNFYHRFIPAAARTLKPLYSALSKERIKGNFEWTKDMEKSFLDAKSALISATMLVHPLAGAPISLTTDASDTAIGAVLQQRVGEVLQPLAFF